MMRVQMLKAPVSRAGYIDTRFLLQTLKTHPEYFSDLPPAKAVEMK